MSSNRIGDFRPIHYLGSKWRILDQVQGAVDAVADPRRSSVADLFAGSGVVARRLAHTRPVWASDIQEYSRAITAAQLSPSPLGTDQLVRSISDALAPNKTSGWLLELVDWERRASVDSNWVEWMATAIEDGSIALQRSPHQPVQEAFASSSSATWTLLHHYGGVYFSYKQAADLDIVSGIVRSLRGDDRDTAMAALLSTATDLVSSVGSHFAQPFRPRRADGGVKVSQLEGVAKTRGKDVLETFAERLRRFAALTRPPFPSTVSRLDFSEALGSLPPEVGTAYADPPYTREHYSRFYHVLETIALGDDPGVSSTRVSGADVPSRGIYRLERHQSPFSIVSSAPAAFESMFRRLADQGVSLVLSYSPVPENDKPRARVISIDALLDLARSHYRRVEVVDASGIRHSKFNSRAMNAPRVDQAEVFILGKS